MLVWEKKIYVEDGDVRVRMLGLAELIANLDKALSEVVEKSGYKDRLVIKSE